MPFGRRQQALLEQYAREMRVAKREVNEWWAKLVAEASAQHKDERKIVDALKARWPDGPAVHPRIVAIIRKYYLAFEELNETLYKEMSDDSDQIIDLAPRGHADEATEEPERPIAPGVILCEGLTSDRTKDLLAIPAAYAYWPISMSQREWRASDPP